ncbi:MAG: hypothetical protein ACOWW1_07960 [archaeon]|jgi:hypothetical protein|nr:hypothetical protein [Candidatus Bathyarchaeum sp.]
MNAPNPQNRKKLKTEMMQTFQTEMQHLNKDVQNILVDDLITTFYSRLQVMTKITQNQ